MGKKQKNPKKVIPIDWDKVRKYLQAGCSGVECASVIGIHENTLYNRCKIDKKVDFVAFKQQNKAKGDALLRAKQYDSAINDKNTSMQIWLGKNRLNQTDKQGIDISVQQKLTDTDRDKILQDIQREKLSEITKEKMLTE